MELSLINETDITKTRSSGLGKSIAGAATDVASSIIPGADIANKVTQISMAIIRLIKTKRDASKLIKQAMALPDNSRDGLNAFDIDDALWGNDGMLHQKAQDEVFRLVQTKLQEHVDNNEQLPQNFSNNIALAYIKAKAKL